MERILYEELLNKIGESVAEKSKDRYIKENVPLCWARFAVIDIIVPEIGLGMEERNTMFLEKETVLNIIETCLNRSWPENVLRKYGFMVDVEITRQALKEKGAEWILQDLMNEMMIMDEIKGKTIFFTKYNYIGLFIRMALYNRIFALGGDMEQS